MSQKPSKPARSRRRSRGPGGPLASGPRSGPGFGGGNGPAPGGGPGRIERRGPGPVGRPMGGGPQFGGPQGGNPGPGGNPVGGPPSTTPRAPRGPQPAQRSNGNVAAGQRRRRGGARRGSGAQNRQERVLKLFEALHQTVSVDPHERWILSRNDGSITPRVLDLITPLGKGQRCLIVAPPKAGKTTLLLEVCKSLEVNHPDALVFALLVDERPEEVTHFRRSCHAEVIAASSDMVAREHVEVVEAAMERILTPVLEGRDVVVLLDSITRLARAYNVVRGDSGRTMSGGLDANAMQIPRRLFGAARNIEDGGSLTILGTALVDTGSRMDQIIFEEFKGTGNSEIVLSRALFEKRIFPALDIAKSGTRKEEKLYDPDQVGQILKIRRVLAGMSPDRAIDGLLKLMAKHATNAELLEALPVR